MYTDRNALDEYAYHGVFYRSEQKPEEDGDLIGSDGDMLGDTDTSSDETENVETIILKLIAIFRKPTNSLIRVLLR